MCFSAQASFIVSGLLLVIGIITLKLAIKKKMVTIALIPLFFAIQQFFEGIQWLYINNGKTSLFFAYAFLFFAFLLWPTYVPIAVFKLDKSRRKILKWLIITGVITSLLFLIAMIINPLSINVVGKCIQYKVKIPIEIISGTLYFITVFLTLILSSKKLLKIIGIITLITAAIAEIFFYAAYTSVWCFFAAITSGLIYLYIKKEK